jgi:hypothetical protein
MQKIVTSGVRQDQAHAALALPVDEQLQDLIHGIHAGRDRVNPFRDARTVRQA